MSLDYDVFVVDPKPIPSAVPGFDEAVGPDSRASWLRALDAVAGLEAGTVIAGHRNPQAADDDARRQIGECRRYLADFEAALERSSTPAQLIEQMTAAYPGLANPYALWVAAYDLLGTPTR